MGPCKLIWAYINCSFNYGGLFNCCVVLYYYVYVVLIYSVPSNVIIWCSIKVTFSSPYIVQKFEHFYIIYNSQMWNSNSSTLCVGESVFFQIWFCLKLLFFQWGIEAITTNLKISVLSHGVHKGSCIIHDDGLLCDLTGCNWLTSQLFSILL